MGFGVLGVRVWLLKGLGIRGCLGLVGVEGVWVEGSTPRCGFKKDCSLVRYCKDPLNLEPEALNPKPLKPVGFIRVQGLGFGGLGVGYGWGVYGFRGLGV